MRLEDIPYAFIEFVESLNINLINIDLCKNLGRQNASKSFYRMNPKLVNKVRQAEPLIFETYEYY